MRDSASPVYMLAADHRWQWEQWCDRNSVSRSRIPETKQLALDGLLAARRRSDDARRCGAFLVDGLYGSAEIQRAQQSGVVVGTPVERPGVFPLEWATEPFWKAASGDVVKVLVRHRPEWQGDVQRAQIARLGELGDWCRSNARVFLLEVLVVAADDETEDEFERSVRPGVVAAFVRDAYAAGVVPDYWKVEGTPVPEAMSTVNDAIAEQDGPRLVILGKGAGFDAIQTWFAAAAPLSRAAGFAIGRSVYWEPAGDYLAGAAAAAEAVERISANYLRAIEAWKGAQRA